MSDIDILFMNDLIYDTVWKCFSNCRWWQQQFDLVLKCFNFGHKIGLLLRCWSVLKNVVVQFSKYEIAYRAWSQLKLKDDKIDMLDVMMQEQSRQLNEQTRQLNEQSKQINQLLGYLKEKSTKGN